MNVIFLGTGAGIPAKTRNVTSIALQLLEERNEIWLFDCGEATQHQILHTSIKPRKIEKIFITHLHGDHIYGLPGLISSRSFQGGETALTIYGPKGIEQFVRTALSVSHTHLTYKIEFIDVKEGVIYEDSSFQVQAKKIEHGIDSYGYRVIEKDLPGTLLVDELKNMGIQPGPIYQKIKNAETVQLEDGSIIRGSDFIGPSIKGRIISILGDTRFTEKSLDLAEDADLLIHEATFGRDDHHLAYDYYHSTTEDAAKIANASNVKKLVLTHISSRYQSPEQLNLLVEEAQEVFPPTIIASDFMEIDIPRKRSI
ncbi:ribonuclease Z [Bacillus sp. UMB0899]|uniref:ribonuclease Z n=1 Tax=Metabacillus schmidteae TaxID=2730405 RepID=UPI000C800E19|nr:ribonuclease Z [Metabacillus schmidteae]PMC39516.1 ribonuclease Z [Bacillus sp. UMB0899]